MTDVPPEIMATIEHAKTRLSNLSKSHSMVSVNNSNRDTLGPNTMSSRFKSLALSDTMRREYRLKSSNKKSIESMLTLSPTPSLEIHTKGETSKKV
jgi:hypothetical protein